MDLIYFKPGRCFKAAKAILRSRLVSVGGGRFDAASVRPLPDTCRLENSWAKSPVAEPTLEGLSSTPLPAKL